MYYGEHSRRADDEVIELWLVDDLNLNVCWSLIGWRRIKCWKESRKRVDNVFQEPVTKKSRKNGWENQYKVRAKFEIKVMVVYWLASRPGEPEARVRVPVRKGLVSCTTLECIGVTVDCASKENWDDDQGASRNPSADVQRHWRMSTWQMKTFDLVWRNEKSEETQRESHYANFRNRKTVDLQKFERLISCNRFFFVQFKE